MDSVDAFPCLQISEYEGAVAAHALGVSVHGFDAGADQRREIDLVDDKEVGAGDSRPAFARDLVASGDIDHVDRQIGERSEEHTSELQSPDHLVSRLLLEQKKYTHTSPFIHTTTLT